MTEPARPRPSRSSAWPARRAATVIALVGGLATVGCEKTPASPPVAPITACPEGAVLEGAAPPSGLRQRCQKSVSERHGASREWYEDGRERTYSEWWQGRKHGRFKLWYRNGRVRSEGAHRHGAPAGPWKYYDEDGTVSQEQTFPTAPPPADWLAKAIAGQPPAAEEIPATPGSTPDPTADPDH